MMRAVLQQFKQKFFQKKNPKLKDTLHIKQSGKLIHVHGYLSNPNYTIKQLHLKLRGKEELLTINNEQNGNLFKFTIDLREHEDFLSVDDNIADFYLYVSVPEIELTPNQQESLKERAEILKQAHMTVYEYRIRLGRFKETYFNIEKPLLNKQLYTTVKGNISLSVNKQIEQKVITQIDYLTLKNETLSFGGRLFTRSHQIEKLEIILLNRNTSDEQLFTVNYEHLTDLTKLRFGLNRYDYDVKIDLGHIINEITTDESVIDLFFDMTFKNEDEIRRIRIGRPRFWARRSLHSEAVKQGHDVFTVSPYYTFRLMNLSLLVDRFDEDTYEYMEKALQWSTLTYRLNKKKDIWLIGERSDKAQDTGYHLFKYIRKNYPHINAYYVIKEDSPEYENVKPLGNVLLYKSKEHIAATLAATRIVGSHHPDYLYPVRSEAFKKNVRGKKVFIQHGIMGTKNMVANYGKNTSGFDTDLFLVSSDREKELVVNDLEYNKDEVAVTGLSRFDALFKQDVTVKRQVVIMPTWREWLVHEDLFLESEYFERYKSLIHNETLHQLAKEHNFEIVFYLHTNMQRYSSHFKGSPVSVISHEDIDVQTLMKESMLMITDYSSVGFDFSFLNRPVIYYQFDSNRFFGKRGSHLDVSNDLPGDIVYTLEEIIELMAYYAEKNFTIKEENKLKSEAFLTYKDQNSAERVFQAIKHKVRKKSIIERISETEIYRILFRRFRKSKWYHPLMRVFYNIVKTVMPIDKKLIVFESGVGKQYADSPRYIYEEIVRQALDYKKVWACNKITRFNDSNTIRIKRYSPSYFYYLARANVWINNQNFPPRLQKREDTTYIQAWHGTPLKKMLFDIDQVMGRTQGYVERISKAVKMWDYLLSPSDYATKAFRSAFKYKGQVIEAGYPRNDLFYQADKDAMVRKVKNRLIIPKNKKVILYAPTFRDNQSLKSNKFIFDLKMDLHKMKEALGDEYIVLLRMHVAITNKLKIDEELEDFVMNVSNYSEMQELLLITDILITDYSSTMFDYANTKRPMIFFTYDLELYRDQIRGFYMDFETEAPGPLVKTTEEIIYSIKHLQEMKHDYQEKYDKFYNKYCAKEDGHAAERIVNNLLIHNT